MGNSKELRSVGEFTHMMGGVLLDAVTRLDDFNNYPVDFGDLIIYSWQQSWSDATCGFPGIGGQAITTAQTVLVMLGLSGPACVYHAGRFAYLVKHPGERFWLGVQSYNLPGADEAERIRRLEHETDYE